jgi:hypothetical protein
MNMRWKTALPLLFLFASCLACQQGLLSPPQKLLGLWTTEAPAYADRYLRIEEDRLVFGVASDQPPMVQRIVRIDVRADEKQTTYTFHSVDAEGEHELVIFYDPAEGGALRIKNRIDVIWKKRG